MTAVVTAIEVVKQYAGRRIASRAKPGDEILADPAMLADIVEEAVIQYEAVHNELAGTPGAVPALADRDGVIDRIVADFSSQGGILAGLMADPEIEEIRVERWDKIRVTRTDGTTALHRRTFRSDEEVDRLAGRLLADPRNVTTSRRFDHRHPRANAILSDGSRLHIVGRPVARNTIINIRRVVGLDEVSLDGLLRAGSFGRGPAAGVASEFLRVAHAAAALNILIGGGMADGKTTLARALLKITPSDEHVVIIESEPEIDPLGELHPDTSAMWEAPHLNIGMRDLIRDAARMRADRLIVGEVLGKECLELLKSLNFGIGAWGTVHCENPRQGVDKLVSLALEASGDVREGSVSDRIGQSVDLWVQCGRVRHRGADGAWGLSRRITEIAAIHSGRSGGRLVPIETIFRYEPATDRLVRAEGMPQRAERFEQRAGIDVNAILAGADQPLAGEAA